MKAYLILGTACEFVALGTARARTNRRRLRAEPPVANLLNQYMGSELFENSRPLLRSRADPAGGDAIAEECSSPSVKWLKQQVATLSNDDLSNFFDWYMHALPFAYKLFVEPREGPASEEYCGANGEFTDEVMYQFEQAQGFWYGSGIQDNIRVLCAHGQDIADREKLVQTLDVMFSRSYTDDYTVLDHADDIQDLVSRLPGGYNFPLLTFNAFATDDDEMHEYPSIIIGDGYFEFQQALGLGSEGPEYALAHEHAHHLQYTLDSYDQDSAIEQTVRRQELMADALSAYFLAHRSGGGMTASNIFNVHEIAYSIGDCETNSNENHHGTPTQRRCSTRWGASYAIRDSNDSTAKLDLREFRRRFDIWYEGIIDWDDACDFDPSSSSPGSKLELNYVAFAGLICALTFVLI